jgi:alanine racemase
VQPYPRTWVDIDLPAIAHNLALVKRAVGPSVQTALVVKADAYGHGLVPVTRFALRHGADWAAVATVQEGTALRDAGVDGPIMVLSPILEIEAEQAVFYRLDTLFEDLRTAQALSLAAQAVGLPARAHLKVDTGLHRFGCSPEEAVRLCRQARALPGLELVGIAQHFADSSRNDDYTRLQETRWLSLLQRLQAAGESFRHVHAANSAGALRYPESRGNLVRIGILAYGIDPVGLLGGKARPAMKWTARVTAIRRIQAGEPVGYCLTFRTTRASRIATLGVGYGDGYPRSLSNKGHVEIHGRRAPVVGLVCMDQTMIDVTDVPETQIGDEALVLGGSVRAEELAEATGTNSHEIVTRLMSRVSRRYHYGG